MVDRVLVPALLGLVRGDPPRRTPYFPNPTHQLDYRRFSSDALLGLFTAERDIIRSHSPADKPITTNFMRFFPHADYWDWAAAEDVVSDDWYPDAADPGSHVEGAAGADLMRSLGAGRPWLLMEQAVSAINWRAVNPPKSGGDYRRWSLQQVARGADAVLHFQWRAAVGGAEKWHSGMLPHAGPRTRTWRGVVELGGELAALRDLSGARTHADVAIVLDWPSWWALELDSRPSTALSFVSILRSWYEPLWRRGYAVDFAHPESDLTGYPLVLVPQLYSVTDRGAQRVIDAAEAGSTVAVGYFSGAVDERDRVRAGGYPAPWQDLLGLWVEEYRPLLPGACLPLESATGDEWGSATGSRWSEHVHLTGAHPVLRYVGGDLDGCAAVTRRDHPDGGAAWYLSTQVDDPTLAALLLRMASHSAAQPILGTAPPRGVEVALRSTSSSDYLFVLNHDQQERTVDTRTTRGGSWRHAISDQPMPDQLSVAAGDVVILVRSTERTSDS